MIFIKIMRKMLKLDLILQTMTYNAIPLIEHSQKKKLKSNWINER